MTTAAALGSLVRDRPLAARAARFGLTRLAGDDPFRRYASRETLRERMRGEKQSLSLCVPHRYLGHAPAPRHRLDRSRRRGPAPRAGGVGP